MRQRTLTHRFAVLSTVAIVLAACSDNSKASSASSMSADEAAQHADDGEDVAAAEAAEHGESKQPAPPAGKATGTGTLDADGVLEMYPPNTSGSSWRLGSQIPSQIDKAYWDTEGDSLSAGTDGNIHYWESHGHTITYAGGSPPGITARFNIRAAGGKQTYTWKDGAIQNGYISSSKDIKNEEATAYVRVSNTTGTHLAMVWKLRGGVHDGSNDPRASDTEMAIPSNGAKPTAARELNHPNYDFVPLTPAFDFEYADSQWFGYKSITYFIDANTTQNITYIDTNPFNADGTPANNWQVYTQWQDVNGKKTGKYYTQAALWAGWVSTLRVDGWNNVDVSILSVREIVPPASQSTKK